MNVNTTIGLAVGNISALIAHLLVHLYVYSDYGWNPFRFFTLPAFAFLISVIASVVYLIFLRKRGAGSQLPKLPSAGASLWRATIVVVIVNLWIAWAGSLGESTYFWYLFVSFVVPTVPLSLAIAVVITPLIAWGMRNYYRRRLVKETTEDQT